MATFTTHAEVVTPDLPQYKMYEAGIKKSPPGRPLADILDFTGGVYEYKWEMSPQLREQIRQVADLTSDEDLKHYASLSWISISLEHLRHLDPQTRVIVGVRLTYAPGESERLGLRREGPIDPRNTVLIDNTETD